jgi:hypothetical protein
MRTKTNERATHLCRLAGRLSDGEAAEQLLVIGEADDMPDAARIVAEWLEDWSPPNMDEEHADQE